MTLIGVESIGPGPEIQNEEEARRAVLEAVSDVVSARAACDVFCPGDQLKTARAQRKAYREFLVKYGVALDRVIILKRCRLLSDVAYNELRSQVMATLVPTVTEVVNGGS